MAVHFRNHKKLLGLGMSGAVISNGAAGHFGTQEVGQFATQIYARWGVISQHRHGC